MGVYFALRTHYEYPSGKYLRYFPDDDTVLAWFQRVWRGVAESEEAQQYACDLLGADVYGFDTIFEAIAAHNLPVPKTHQELLRVLRAHLYVEGEIRSTARAMQILTDDDELELAYYFFDDRYCAEYPNRAAYLLHEDWRLPEAVEPSNGRLPPIPAAVKSLEPGGKGTGVVYAVFLAYYDSANLSDFVNSYRIRGARLPDLPAYLAAAQTDEQITQEIPLLRALTVSADGVPRANLTMETLLREAATVRLSSLHDILYRERFGNGTPAEDRAILERAVAKVPMREAEERGNSSQVQSAEHIAQLSFHSDTWGKTPLYQNWIFFDDVWLRANAALGAAILRFGARWDVL